MIVLGLNIMHSLHVTAECNYIVEIWSLYVHYKGDVP